MIKGSHSASASTYCNFFFNYYSKHSQTLSLVEQFHLMFNSFLLCRTKNFPPYNFHHSFLLLTFVWIVKEVFLSPDGFSTRGGQLWGHGAIADTGPGGLHSRQFPPQNSCHLTSHNLCCYLWDKELIKTGASQPFLFKFFFLNVYTLFRYSWLTIVQVHSGMIWLNVYCFFRWFSITGYYIDYSSLRSTVNLCCLLHIFFF